MTRPHIVVTEAAGFSPVAVALLEEAGEVTLADLDRPGLLRAARGADVLWVRLRHRIDAEVLAAGPRLRAIATPTTGLTHVDLAAAERRDVRVVSLRGEREFLRDVRATAEHTIALLLALLRRLPAAAAHAASGRWDRDGFRGGELHGRTVGIVGYGRLGRIVARYLQAFDAHVLAADPHVDPDDVAPGVTLVPLDALLAAADVVLLHASHEPGAGAWFGRAQFAAMRPGARFVNTARGELVDEAALLEALASGALAGAALDVVADERAEGMPDHPLLAYARRHANLIVTPHIGGCTEESMTKTETFLARKLCATLDADRAGGTR